ncbi:MAG: DUF943 family protein [Pantoea sp.]|uniref:DUF943 family protein n=1 Tax=Pantoea septica TaxID=472695 RepID=UPI000E9DCEEF|nr:DUF943 family protein [Pantoea septica]MBU5378549.1 DUF943 family protein [Pantoea septica]MDU5838981.1 DUF943 family protein [Pantoea sp.]MDU6442825.1 DUF943 family protein [Pantoea sp.]HAT24422.1 hypothetical protein [Pantoea septica]
MKSNIKKTLLILVIAGGMLMGYFLWLTSRPIEITAVHQEDNFSDVLVNHFPSTIRGKIDWWLKNKEVLKQRYDIPKPAPYGNYTVSFWLFGEGYKEEGKYDRLCFKDMQPPINCIEKERVFWVSYSKNRGVIFTIDDGEYRIGKDGKIIKLKDE